MPNADIVTLARLAQQTCPLVTACARSPGRRSIAAIGHVRIFLLMQPTMPTTHPGGDLGHTSLKPQEVLARYRWGRTRGYLELKKATIARRGGNYRLDTFIVWEDWCLTANEPERDATVIATPLVEPVPVQAPNPVDVPVPVNDTSAEISQRRQSRRRRPPDAQAAQGWQACCSRNPHRHRAHQRRWKEVARPVLRPH